MKDNWFSNFLPFDEPLIHRDISYPTVEHYFQAMKTTRKHWRKAIANCSTPGKAKRMGRKAPLREHWDQLKLKHMELALQYKFKRGTTWHKKLIKSKGDLIEWNYWHDNFWGNCVCKKCRLIRSEPKNMLGVLLMKLRVKLLREEVFERRSENAIK